MPGACHIAFAPYFLPQMGSNSSHSGTMKLQAKRKRKTNKARVPNEHGAYVAA